MATLKEIKARVRGVKNTQKITKAMKMVAAAKLRRATEKIMAARPYADALTELLSELISSADPSLNKLLEKREVKNKLLIVVSSDRGLAGSFNANLIKYTFNIVRKDESYRIITIGKKITDASKRVSNEILETHPGFFASLDLDASNAIVKRVVDLYLSKQIDSVEIVYNKFISVARQVITIEQFLPFKEADETEGGSTSVGGKKTEGGSTEVGNGIEGAPKKKKATTGEFIYEPSAQAILDDIIPKMLNIQLWKVILESNASEQAARMTAMETATKNASDLLTILELSYNTARQAAITKEILEIVGGAEALKDA